MGAYDTLAGPSSKNLVAFKNGIRSFNTKECVDGVYFATVACIVSRIAMRPTNISETLCV